MLFGNRAMLIIHEEIFRKIFYAIFGRPKFIS